MIKGGVPLEFLEELCAKTDLVTVASRYLTLTHRGGNYWARCPFHNEKTASFTIKEDGQFYKCCGCGEAGNVINLVAKMENVDFLTAVEMLAKEANMPLPTDQESEEIKKQKQQRETMYAILKATTDFYHNNLLNNPNSPQGQYIKSRGLTSETIEKFKIGASLNYEGLINHLLQMNFKPADMVLAGVVGRGDHGLYDFYGGRVIFPIFNGFGDVVAFSGRSIEQSPEHTKYKNTSQTLIFNKSEILFGYNFVRELKKQRMLDSIVIVEGHIDVIMCHQAGITNVIGCMGTALTPLHAKKIKTLVDNVILCLDGDSAGANATYKAIDTLKEADLNVRVVRLTGAKDPDEYIKKFGKDKFVEFLENAIDCVDFVLQDSAKKYNLENNSDKNKYVKEALNYISKFTTPAEQEIYLQAVQQKVEIPIDALRNSLTRVKTNSAQKQIEQEGSEIIKDRYVLDGKITILAGILYNKIKNYEDFAGIFNTEDELSELYKFFVSKIKENKPINPSILFDNFKIEPNSAIDKVINYVFPADNVFETIVKDSSKRVKLYSLRTERDKLIQLMNSCLTDVDRYNYLAKIKQIDETINKEKV